MNRAASWAKLKKSMEVWYLPNYFWTAMDKGVAHIINQEGTTNNIPLPFTVSTHPGRMQLWEASKQQSKIGWINVLKGRLSIRWQDYVIAHLKASIRMGNKMLRSIMGTYTTDMAIQERRLPRG
jgi:hypothetical protein